METISNILAIIRLVFQYLIPLSNSFSAYTHSGNNSTTKKHNQYIRSLLKFWIFDMTLAIAVILISAVSSSYWIEISAITLLIIAQRNKYQGVDQIYTLIIVNAMKLYETHLNQYINSALDFCKYCLNYTKSIILPQIISKILTRILTKANSKTEQDLDQLSNERKEIDDLTPSDSSDTKLVN